ncbi:MAG: hypothetical protein ACI4Q4_04395 [Oscillospiraceae bacterium]
MELFFRYWLYLMKTTVKLALPSLAVILALDVFFLFDSLSKGGVSLIFVLLIAATLLVYPVIGLVNTLKDFSVKKALDEYGFSTEYLAVFEEKMIKGKPFKESTAVQYAEIYSRMGRPEAAISYLNTLNLTTDASRLACIYVYMMSALMLGDSALAERLWAQNQDYIQKAFGNKQNIPMMHIVYLSMIYADCCAGRFERALEQTEKFMSSDDFKRYNAAKADFDIIRVYALKMLGRDNEAAALCTTVSQNIENSRNKLVYRWQYDKLREDLQKALAGQIPL